MYYRDVHGSKPGAPNSAKFRGVAEGQPRLEKGGGGCNNVLLFTR